MSYENHASAIFIPLEPKVASRLIDIGQHVVEGCESKQVRSKVLFAVPRLLTVFVDISLNSISGILLSFIIDTELPKQVA